MAPTPVIQRNETSLLLTGFMATLSGVGLARFAYTALMPQMVHADWFSGEQVAYLGAANLLGYLIGALAAAPLAERLGALRVLLWCWVALALSFAACAWPLTACSCWPTGRPTATCPGALPCPSWWRACPRGKSPWPTKPSSSSPCGCAQPTRWHGTRQASSS